MCITRRDSCWHVQCHHQHRRRACRQVFLLKQAHSQAHVHGFYTRRQTADGSVCTQIKKSKHGTGTFIYVCSTFIYDIVVDSLV